ncbi:MAG: InlB B-repeat-containing protein [Anaerovoracaceae bacterium]
MRTKKKKGLKQYLAFALVLVMVATMIPLSAFAEEGNATAAKEGTNVTENVVPEGAVPEGAVPEGPAPEGTAPADSSDSAPAPAPAPAPAGPENGKDESSQDKDQVAPAKGLDVDTSKYDLSSSSSLAKGAVWNVYTTKGGGQVKVTSQNSATFDMVLGYREFKAVPNEGWEFTGFQYNAQYFDAITKYDSGEESLSGKRPFSKIGTWNELYTSGNQIRMNRLARGASVNPIVYTLVANFEKIKEEPEVVPAELTFNKGEFAGGEIDVMKTEVGKTVSLPAAPKSTKEYATFDGWMRSDNVIVTSLGDAPVLAPGTEVKVDGDATYMGIWSINAKYYVHKEKDLNLNQQNKYGNKSVSSSEFYSIEQLGGLDMTGKLTSLPKLKDQGSMKNYLPAISTDAMLSSRYAAIDGFLKTSPSDDSIIDVINGDNGKTYALNWYVIKEEDNGRSIHVDGFLQEVKASEFTVTFKDGVDQTLFQDSVVTVKAGDLTPVPPNMEAHQRDGYKFVGWSPEYKVEKVNKNLEYTAQWEKAEVSLSYDANLEGATAPDKTTVKYGEEATVAEAPKAPKAFYEFEGWTAGDKQYKPGDKIKLTEDMNLKAQWKIVAKYVLHKDKNLSLAKQNEYGSAGAAPVEFYQEHTKYGTLKAMPKMEPSSKNDKALIYLPSAADDTQLANRYNSVNATLGQQPDSKALVAELKAAGKLANDKEYTVRWYVVKEVFDNSGKTREIHIDGFVEEAKDEPLVPPVTPEPPIGPVIPDDEGGADEIGPGGEDKPGIDDEGGSDSIKPGDTVKPGTDDEGKSDSVDKGKDNKDNAVQTGDSFDIALWASIVILSGIVILGLLAIRRKENQ